MNLLDDLKFLDVGQVSPTQTPTVAPTPQGQPPMQENLLQTVGKMLTQENSFGAPNILSTIMSVMGG